METWMFRLRKGTIYSHGKRAAGCLNLDAKTVKQLNSGMGLGFGFVLLEIAGGAGFCVRAAGDRFFACVMQTLCAMQTPGCIAHFATCCWSQS